jgi:cyclophilin family peptidyl-prolyl cis-trans isomerase
MRLTRRAAAPRRRSCILLFALAVGACHQPRPAGPAPAASGAELLRRPGDPFWRTRAPDTTRARFVTSQGIFVIECYRPWAPLGVDRLYNLVRAGFFDDSRFFRVLPRYVVQFGIPGDPAVTAAWVDRALPDDPPREPGVRGTVGYAMRGPNDRRTQLYINLADNRRNDPEGFAIIGRVVEGMDVVDRLNGEYGEGAGGGMRRGLQQRVLTEGNAYLDEAFPRLDRLVRATLDGAAP